MKRATKLKALAPQAREDLAVRLLAPNVVVARMAEVAAAGGNLPRLSLHLPADLRRTAAAEHLVALLMREGFSVTWESRLFSAKQSITGNDVIVSEPVIGWDQTQADHAEAASNQISCESKIFYKRIFDSACAGMR